MNPSCVHKGDLCEVPEKQDIPQVLKRSLGEKTDTYPAHRKPPGPALPSLP